MVNHKILADLLLVNAIVKHTHTQNNPELVRYIAFCFGVVDL